MEGITAESVLFDPDWYASQIEQTVPRDELYRHWVDHGIKNGLDPHPAFSLAYYLTQAGETTAPGQNPLECFLSSHDLDICPHPLFDSKWYLRAYPDVAQSGANPLIHYLLHGGKEGRGTGTQFDSGWYLEQNPDVRVAGMNPLIHYIVHGQREGRPKNRIEQALSQFRMPASGASSRPLSRAKKDAEPRRTVTRLELALTPKTRLVTVDVWDTLLRRKCHPDEIKLQAARYLWLHAYWNLRPAYRDLKSLYRLRLASEDAGSHTADFEYRYAEAVHIWLDRALEKGVSDSRRVELAEQLLSFEYQAELKATECDEVAIEALRRNNKVPIAFASDFYMPQSFIERLLKENGAWLNFVRGYSSCETLLNKRSGRMYGSILEDFALEPEELLHVGDNWHADVSVPQSLGIKTQHYVDAGLVSRRDWHNNAFKALLEGDSTIHEERLAAIVSDLPVDTTASEAERSLFHTGRELAPMVVGYILFVIEESLKFGVDKVHFFTREGQFLKQVYDEVTKSDPYGGQYPISELLEVSRLATFAPSLSKVDSENLMRLWSLYSAQSPLALCKTLQVEKKPAKKIFERNGLSFDAVVEHPWKDARFIKAIESAEFQALVRQRCEEQRNLLTRYLESKGISNSTPSTVVVDVGWRGTIQDNLAHIVDSHIHGCYLGLFRFLNKQPSNTSKQAWLFDNNDAATSIPEFEVSPLEMLFTSPGGSVTGYRGASAGKVEALRDADAEEERVYEGALSWVQKGVLSAISEIVSYVSLHGLTSRDLQAYGKGLAKNLVTSPNEEFANAFFSLSHNETFGTGEYKEMSLTKKFKAALVEKMGSKLHFAVKQLLDEVRWQSGFVKLPDVMEALKSLPSEKRVHLPRALVDGQSGLGAAPKVGFFVPPPLPGSGGHRTIFNLARALARAGFEVSCFLEDEGHGVAVAEEYIGEDRVNIYVGWPSHLSLDVAFATIAHSAPFVAKLEKALVKCYLVQDFEAWFNPVGDAYTVAENSYTHGLVHFTIGNWLTHVIRNQYGGRSVPAGLGVDTGVYRVLPAIQREKAVCFLYQPEKPRRNPALAIEALRLVKQRHPDTKVLVYGSDAPISLDFEVENLGLVRDLRKLNELYNRCAVGLCLSMSNPSRIPFEMMAAGCVPVDVYRYNNLLDYEDSTLELSYQSPESLAEAMCALLENERALQKRSAACVEFASSRSLEWENDVIVNSLTGLVAGYDLPNISVATRMNSSPVISTKDAAREVRAYCEWQRHLASA